MAMPLKRDLTLVSRASLLLTLLVGLVSAAGLASGSTVDPKTGFGVTTSTAGVLVPGFLAQDILNLVVGLPVLIGALWLARRGSVFGLLLWPGALFYLVYTFAHYVMAAPFGPLFLGHVAIVVLSAWTMTAMVTAIDGDAVRVRLAGAVRPRLVGGILVGLALLTVGQDATGALSTAVSNAGPIDPVARGVWTADLTLAVPAMLIVGGLLWRRAALGYVAAAGLLLSFGLTSVVIAAMILLQPVLTGAPIDGATVVGLLIFGAVSLAPLLLFARGTDTRPVVAESGAVRAAART
jgi:hypothetical protein